MAPRTEARQSNSTNTSPSAKGNWSMSGLSKVNGRKRSVLPSSRMSSNGISTDVTAYPRTDPIHALNSLLKLVKGLPGRIGGCRYKFTEAEQVLCVHLVEVLEPFVYQGARALGVGGGGGRGGGGGGGGGGVLGTMMLGHNLPAPAAVGLVQQATEILDNVLFYVDGKKDLLNVGLTCRRMWDVVFPRHFEYRVVRCKVSSVGVWNHLIRNRALARNVRVLEVVDERVSGAHVGMMSSGAGGGRNMGFVNGSFGSIGMGSTSTRKAGMMIPRGILQTDTDLESTDDELTMHAKQERYLVMALTRMTALNEFKWSSNHSPISFADLWGTLSVRAGAGLRVVKVVDNMVWAPKVIGEGDGGDDGGDSGDDDDDDDDDADEESGGRKMKEKEMVKVKDTAVALPFLRSVTIHSTNHTYGAVKQPELGRISGMLNQCVNLKELDISYTPPRGSSAAHTAANNNNINFPGLNFNFNPRTKPIADELLLYSRWSTTLTHLTLKNLRCVSSVAPSVFLAEHWALEVLCLDIVIHYNVQVNATTGTGSAGTGSAGAGSAGMGSAGMGSAGMGSAGAGTAGATPTRPLVLPPNSLPRLREIRASREVINAILQCPCDVPRPIEIIKGFKLCNQGQGGGSTSTSTANTTANTTVNTTTNTTANTTVNTSASTNTIGTSRAAQLENEFLAGLRGVAGAVRRVELSGWHDMEEVRRLLGCVPGINYLDVGRRLGGSGGGGYGGSGGHGGGGYGGHGGGNMNSNAHNGSKSAAAPATNHMEWAETLGTLAPELVAFHGVKFFYELTSASGGGNNLNSAHRFASGEYVNSHSGESMAVNAGALAGQHINGNGNLALSNMERSRLRKNDEIAGVLAWKCKKLRRVDHWEDGTGKVIVLHRDSRDGHGEEGMGKGKGKDREGKVRWEIRRLKA